jgi:hypothetical protein
MKKIAITQELLDIANELDNIKLFKEANTLTKIAHIIVAEDYKHDPMVYNPDEKDGDVQEAHSMDYLDAMEALNKLVESGELNPNELSQIQSILSDSDQGPDPFKEMSLDEDDEDDEHYMTDEELDEQFDNDPSDMDDDMDDDDRRDKNHQENDGHYFFQDEDDF